MARRRPTEPTVNPARGAALVVVAVLLGLFLLRNGLDTSEVVTASDDDGGSVEGSDEGSDQGSDEGADGGSDEGATDDTTPPARTPDLVPTIVLNASGVSGAAGLYSEALLSAGYQLTDADGANADANVPSTQVLYAEGFEQEAAAVAAAIGAPALVPSPLGAAPPGPIEGAMVVVLLGPDLASTPPTTVAAGAGTTDTSDTTVTSTDG